MDTGIWTSHEASWVQRNWLVKIIFLMWFPIPFFFRPFIMRIQKKLGERAGRGGGARFELCGPAGPPSPPEPRRPAQPAPGQLHTPAATPS